jgi:protein-S-isoprenylcysteine O-methyltransferase Ste14
MRSHIILATVWIVYCVLHSLLASIQVKGWMHRKMGTAFKYYRIGYTIFSFLGLVAILIYQFSIESVLFYLPPTWISILALLIMISGGAIMLMMIWKYFRQLSGIKWLATEKIEARLEVKGLHQYVRHPLYLGTFLFLWGWFLYWPLISFFLATTIITIYTLIGLDFEEKKLIREFGNDYIEYMKKVPRLIPRF